MSVVVVSNSFIAVPPDERQTMQSQCPGRT
jgi:hypothetical protein